MKNEQVIKFLQNTTIKPIDKGGVITIINIMDCLAEIESLLNKKDF